MCLLFTARALSEHKGNNLFTQHQWNLKAYGLTFIISILLVYSLSANGESIHQKTLNGFNC